ncbi:TerD family protein [Streptomyces sp. NPDC050528]|uniref:TerD family protein n=1 Tax=Streptomyces sp. NPDC050528 TaxID=3365623 RepID=UPI0037A83F80
MYTAIGEPASSPQERPARLLAGDGYDFARRVYQELGGKPVDHNTWVNNPEETQRQWQLSRLATESLRYLQLQEALGRPPTAKEFGAQRLTWPWPGEETKGWPVLQHVLAMLTRTSPPSAMPHSPTDPPPLTEENGTRRLLAKGTNTVVHTEPTTVRITATGAPVDVSAVLLTRNGKVRSDHDLVFYNHPSQDGVSVGGGTVTADLGLVPDDVVTIAVIVSIDLEAQPVAVFDQYTLWQAGITQASGAHLSFAPGPFSSGETVTIAVELYRHTTGWKARAVGQGYDTGLAGLATDYGITIDT